jgi:hypothetical protein
VTCVNRMGWQKFEQCSAIKLRVRLGKSATVTCVKLQRPLENIPCPGHKSVLEGQEKVENEPHAGRPSTSKMDDIVERVRTLVRSDC